MAGGQLMLHRGAVEVTREELNTYEAPPPTATWFPIAHRVVLDTVLGTLGEAGFQVTRQSLAIAKDGHRFFGTLDLSTTLADGVALSVGVRSSTDKSFPLGWACGSRVFVCD